MIGCRHFSGYKPCGLNATCDTTCPHLEVARPYILIVHLEALGAVLRATSILPAIKRRYPKAHITWITQNPAQALLKPNALIDRVLTTQPDDQLVLRALNFDLALVLDKSLKAAGVLALTKAGQVRGFVSDPNTGTLIPANPEAEELWQLGLSDNQKFYVNQKPETQLLIEALALGPYLRDPYQVQLSESELQLAQERRLTWGHKGLIIGLNTGCSGVIPYKRFSNEFHRRLIGEIQNQFNATIILLGGPEDEVRNQQIAHGLKVIQSPTNRGLRDGLASVQACDIVVSGDSLGMHMAIALKKWVVAWFGPTCAQEIDLYDRGVHLLAEVGCSPCWKRSCSKAVMCYDQVPINQILDAIQRGIEWKTLSSKPPILETSFLASL